MSIYHTMNGVSQAVFFILPMLGKHPDEYPRFRDCFLTDQEHPEYDNHIHVYTRTGGGNRPDYLKENQEMREHPNFVVDYDDSYDPTYASWVFTVPEQWKDDFDKIVSHRLSEISDEYRQQLEKIFPKLKEKFAVIFDS